MMPVSGIQGGGNFSSFLGISQQKPPQPVETTSQASGSGPVETSSSNLSNDTENSSRFTVGSDETPRLTDFQTFVGDLQSGNLSGALQALAELRAELQGIGVDSLSTSTNSLQASDASADSTDGVSFVSSSGGSSAEPDSAGAESSAASQSQDVSGDSAQSVDTRIDTTA
jgi:hypothetical protein